jgi:hypothetical protein
MTGINRKTLLPEQVEELYQIPVQTLANWRSKKIGPAYSKPGRRILYRPQDIEAFLDRTKQHTTGRLS